MRARPVHVPAGAFHDGQAVDEGGRPAVDGRIQAGGPRAAGVSRRAACARAAQALQELGFGDADILQFTCEDLCSRMDEMLRHASEFAGFGYEVVLMRRYKALCEQGGCGWLLVYAPHDEQAAQVADIALRGEALTAVKYHRLVEEDLV
jgi:hypothetical protein